MTSASCRGAGARALRSAGPGLHSGAEWCAAFGATGGAQRQWLCLQTENAMKHNDDDIIKVKCGESKLE